MCRYAFHIYRPHFACFSCRKMFRPMALEDVDEKRADKDMRHVPCPDCKQPMHDMGLNFKAPRQDNVRQWRKVHMLYAHGLAWHDCGCGGTGPHPHTLREAKDLLAQRKPVRLPKVKWSTFLRGTKR